MCSVTCRWLHQTWAGPCHTQARAVLAQRLWVGECQPQAHPPSCPLSVPPEAMGTVHRGQWVWGGAPQSRSGMSPVLLPCRDPEARDVTPPCDTLGPAVSSSLSGIDHEALSRQIAEYKRRKDKGCGGVSPVWSGPEQVAELTKQKKKRKRCKPRPDNDLSQELPMGGGE